MLKRRFHYFPTKIRVSYFFIKSPLFSKKKIDSAKLLIFPQKHNSAYFWQEQDSTKVRIRLLSIHINDSTIIIKNMILLFLPKLEFYYFPQKSYHVFFFSQKCDSIFSTKNITHRSNYDPAKNMIFINRSTWPLWPIKIRRVMNRSNSFVKWVGSSNEPLTLNTYELHIGLGWITHFNICLY